MAKWELREDLQIVDDAYWSKYGGGITSAPERERWLAEARRKLKDCEATPPSIWQRLSGELPSIEAMLVPPFALLIAGYIIGWVVRGFRAQA